jgi:hypothetical protein
MLLTLEFNYNQKYIFPSPILCSLSLTDLLQMMINPFISKEKCHIALLATEARKQSELLYALRAVTKWLS